MIKFLVFGVEVEEAKIQRGEMSNRESLPVAFEPLVLCC